MSQQLHNIGQHGHGEGYFQGQVCAFYAIFDRFVPAKALEQQSTAQRTIFYNGAMNVYEIPAKNVIF